MAATVRGLSGAEAVRRLAADGPNLLSGSAPKSSAVIVRDVLTEPMFLMLLAAGGICLALGSRAEALFLWASCSWSSASPSCRSAGRSGRSNRYSAQAAALMVGLSAAWLGALRVLARRHAAATTAGASGGLV